MARTSSWQSTTVATILLSGCTGGDGGVADDQGPAAGSEMDDDDGPNIDTGEADSGATDIDPGRVTLHRLNRVEYDNTMRDLFFGMDLRLAASFPAESGAFGYDNIADNLGMAPVLFDLYEQASEKLLAEALANPDNDHIRTAILSCDLEGEDPDACGREILGNFGRRAWRRPLTDAEIEGLHDHVAVAMAAGATREEGIVVGLSHALLSVHFLFRVEIDPDPTSLEPHLLGDFELASRLSYFMWSSMPDEELSTLAEQGALQDEEEIGKQMQRMIADPRAIALLDNFTGQWLGLRAMAELDKDPGTFPDLDDALRTAMVGESRSLVVGLFTGKRTLLDLLTSDETVINDRLARHYGLPEPGTDELVPTTLGDLPRRGLVTQAGMMAVTAEKDRTSATRRGNWLLGHILCQELDPPDVIVDMDLREPMEGETTRDVLEQHRADPTCAGCHSFMDPIGLAFENYDGVGAWRELDNGLPIDASGELPDGTDFVDGLELLAHWAEQNEPFALCATQNVLTYALGREIGASDASQVQQLAEELVTSDFSLPVLLFAVARSDVFRFRRGEPG